MVLPLLGLLTLGGSTVSKGPEQCQPFPFTDSQMPCLDSTLQWYILKPGLAHCLFPFSSILGGLEPSGVGKMMERFLRQVGAKHRDHLRSHDSQSLLENYDRLSIKIPGIYLNTK